VKGVTFVTDNITFDGGSTAQDMTITRLA